MRRKENWRKHTHIRTPNKKRILQKNSTGLDDFYFIISNINKTCLSIKAQYVLQCNRIEKWVLNRLAKSRDGCTWHLKGNCRGRHSPSFLHYIPYTPRTVIRFVPFGWAVMVFGGDFQQFLCVHQWVVQSHHQAKPSVDSLRTRAQASM